jgi:Ca2+-binding EF-hand superfamily protein
MAQTATQAKAGFFQEMDKNHNGKVTKDEFKAFFANC